MGGGGGGDEPDAFGKFDGSEGLGGVGSTPPRGKIDGAVEIIGEEDDEGAVGVGGARGGLAGALDGGECAGEEGEAAGEVGAGVGGLDGVDEGFDGAEIGGCGNDEAFGGAAEGDEPDAIGLAPAPAGE